MVLYLEAVITLYIKALRARCKIGLAKRERVFAAVDTLRW